MGDDNGLRPDGLLRWLGKVVRDLPAQVSLYGPRPAIDRGLRERIMLAVTEVHGDRYSALIHEGWAEMSSGRFQARDEVALAYARKAAETGELPPSAAARDALEAVFSPAEVRAVDAAIAAVAVSNVVGGTVDDLVDRVVGEKPRDRGVMLQEAVVAAASVPLGVPLLAWGALMRQAARSLPEVEVVTPPAGQASVLVLMLAEMARRHSGLPLVRVLASGRLPFALALRAGVMEATVRLHRSRLELEDGVAADVAVVIEGDPEALLAAATGQANLLGLVSEGRIRLKVP